MSVNASQLRIVKYPAEVLRRKASPIAEITDEVREVAKRMIDLMYEAEGIGLAAPQVGLEWRMFVLDIPEDEEGERSAETQPMTATTGPMVFINPTVSGFSRDLVIYDEGCLSLPHITGEVRRPSICTVSATRPDGESFTVQADGLLSRCIQHEFDHLDGTLIIDKFDPATRRRVKPSLESLESASRVIR
ncbi:MAG: peptide deformylase [Phycisphaerales bacterium]